MINLRMSLIKASLGSRANLMKNMLAHKPKHEDERDCCFCRQLFAENILVSSGNTWFSFPVHFLIGDLDCVSVLRPALTTQPH